MSTLVLIVVLILIGDAMLRNSDTVKYLAALFLIVLGFVVWRSL